MYEMHIGLIYRKKSNRVLFFPRAMEQDLLHKYHNDFGHFGTDKTLALLQEAYWFSNMKSKVQDHIRNYTKCIAFSKVSGKTEEFMYSTPKDNVPFTTMLTISIL